MKTTYVEHGKGYNKAHGFVSHDNLQPVPRERVEEIIFSDTPFLPPAPPKPQLVATAER